MNANEILNKLNNIKKGRFISLKKRKDLGSGVEKISDLVIRLGVDYANMAINKDRKDAIGALPWGHWVEGLEGLVIEHTNKQGEHKLYLRVASSYSNTSRSVYMQNGVEISKEDATAIIGEKKMQSSNPDVYNIDFNNILELGS